MSIKKTKKEKIKIINSIKQSLNNSDLTVKEACKAHEISSASYYNWKKQYQQPENQNKKSHTNNISDDLEEKIVDMKRNHPYYGQKKICMQLKRFHGLDVKKSQVAKILKKHNLYETSSAPRRKKGKRRFERVSTNELWQMDLMHYSIKNSGKFYLISVLDDHSRFICAHKVCTTKKAENVIDTFKMAVENHELPNQVLTDRGSQFHSWKGITQFRKTLDKLKVKHILASPQSPQTIGKIESWHRNIQRELLKQKKFESIEQARDAIAEYVEHYNYERVHMGIDYLTPADRYFGIADDLKDELNNSTENDGSFYLTARIDGQPIRAEKKNNNQVAIKLAGQEIKTIDSKKIKSLLL